MRLTKREQVKDILIVFQENCTFQVSKKLVSQNEIKRRNKKTQKIIRAPDMLHVAFELRGGEGRVCISITVLHGYQGFVV